MLTTVGGKYIKGTITLFETPEGVEESQVLVTFLTGIGLPGEHKQMVFGQFSGSVLPTEEDFKIAEWHDVVASDDNDGR
jgi:hypothetical protein